MAVRRTHHNRDCCGVETAFKTTCSNRILDLAFRAVQRSRQSRGIHDDRDRSRHEPRRYPFVLQKPQISYAALFQRAAAAVTYCGPPEHVAPAPVVENMIPVTAVSGASRARAVNAAPAPDVEYVSPAPALIYGSPASTVCAVPARVGKYISPAPTMIHAVSAPVIEHIFPHQRQW